MKKSLLALAVLGAFAGAAQAQSSVQIYGSFDGGLRQQTNVNAAGDNNLTMGSNGTYNSNRIGFKGVEDLGGGLNAHFTLETGFNTGTGALNNTTNQLFQRQANVGIGGTWGSLDFGRQYTVAFKTVAAYDPFNYKYTAIIPTSGALVAAGTRNNNDVQYTGTFGPVTARAEWALGEVAGSTRAGSTKAIGASYDQGPFAAGIAYTDKRGALPLELQTKHWTLGGAYKFGPARVAVGYVDNKDQIAGTGDTKSKVAWLGGSYALTPAVEATAAYYRTKVDGTAATADGKKDLYVIGATYAFSKRTNFYADVDLAKLEGSQRIGTTAPAIQDRQRGVSVGINHLF
jgi:predicted porin